MNNPLSSNVDDANQLERYREAERRGQEHLSAFDTLDYEVYSHQDWGRLHESHHEDIIVHMPDGRIVTGICDHVDDLKQQFVFAPDTQIREHPVKIADGEWTSVIGTLEGTFTHPMPMPDGSSIQPTGKTFRLPMCTVGHWVDGRMDEEYLFWDNLAFMKQIGVMA